VKYRIRFTQDYCLVVEAADEDAAMEVAYKAAADDWDKTSSQFEIDDTYNPEEE
jgi:hypothetical protein